MKSDKKIELNKISDIKRYIEQNYTPNTEVQKAVEDGVRGFAEELKFPIDKTGGFHFDVINSMGDGCLSIINEYVDDVMERFNKEQREDKE